MGLIPSSYDFKVDQNTITAINNALTSNIGVAAANTSLIIDRAGHQSQAVIASAHAHADALVKQVEHSTVRVLDENGHQTVRIIRVAGDEFAKLYMRADPLMHKFFMNTDATISNLFQRIDNSVQAVGFTTWEVTRKIIQLVWIMSISAVAVVAFFIRQLYDNDYTTYKIVIAVFTLVVGLVLLLLISSVIMWFFDRHSQVLPPPSVFVPPPPPQPPPPQPVLAPIGSVVAYLGNLAVLNPVGARQKWMECDGSILSSADYPDLFATLQHLYGNGAGGVGPGVHFNIPDLRGYFLRGLGANDPDLATRIRPKSTATAIGASVGTVQDSAFATHTHNIPPNSFQAYKNIHGQPGHTCTWTVAYGAPGIHYSVGETTINTSTSTSTSSGSAETRPMNVAVHWIIRVL